MRLAAIFALCSVLSAATASAAPLNVEQLWVRYRGTQTEVDVATGGRTYTFRRGATLQIFLDELFFKTLRNCRTNKSDRVIVEVDGDHIQPASEWRSSFPSDTFRDGNTWFDGGIDIQYFPQERTSFSIDSGSYENGDTSCLFLQEVFSKILRNVGEPSARILLTTDSLYRIRRTQ